VKLVAKWLPSRGPNPDRTATIDATGDLLHRADCLRMVRPLRPPTLWEAVMIPACDFCVVAEQMEDDVNEEEAP
jgi:hypothetical protein